MKTVMLIFAVLFTLVFLAWSGTRGVNNIIFDREVGGYLKRAADSNTVKLAVGNLEIAIKNIKANGMTSGYTSILYQTPNEDVGFWHDNLEASLNELLEVRSDASQLERSNVLIKLRETLLNQQSQGVDITVPPGIKNYPNNRIYAFWGLVSFFLAVAFWFLWLSDCYCRPNLRYRIDNP